MVARDIVTNFFMVYPYDLKDPYSSSGLSQPNNPSGSRTRARQIEAEQVRLLYRQAPAGFVGTVLNAGIVTFVLWRVVTHPILITWFASMVAITLLRFVLVWMYRRAAPTTDRIRPWRTLLIISYGVAGMAWGVAGILFFLHQSLVHQVFLAFVLGGMAAGAVVTLSSVMAAFMAFFVPTWLPITVRFFIQGGDVPVAMGLLMLCFAGVLLAMARHFHTSIAESLNLRFENLGLVQSLSVAKDQAEEANCQLAESNDLLKREITERKQAEEALEDSEKRYRNLFEDANDAIITFTLDGTITSVNRGLEVTLGWSREELIGQYYTKLLTPSFVAVAEERFRRIRNGEKFPTIFEFEAVRKDGSVVLLEGRTRFIRNKEGKPIGFQGIYRNITERKRAEEALRRAYDELEMRVQERTAELLKANAALQAEIAERKRAEEALRESERRYRLLAENVTDVIWTTDLNLRTTYISPSITRQRGYSVEEAMALRPEEALTPASLEVAMKAFAEELAIDSMEQKDLFRSRALEFEVHCKDGSTIWTEAKMTFLRDRDGRPLGILGVSRDITERKRAEEALARANTELQLSLKQLEQAYRDLQHSQETLLQAERMAALGRLAAGIAHEMNTPLGASLTSLKLMQELVKEYGTSIGDPEVSEGDHQDIAAEMDKLVRATQQWMEKAARYIRSLKLHTRDLNQGEERDFSVPQIIEDVGLLLSHRLRLSQCTLSVSCTCPEPILHGDPGRLGQMLTNLVVNATDAYREAGRQGGEIRVEVSQQGEFLEIRVRDQGCGIAAENIERIFEEFFSTKPLGEGMGLGLSIVRDIITNFFKGTISAESVPGQGSTFVLQLPRGGRREEERPISDLYPPGYSLPSNPKG